MVMDPAVIIYSQAFVISHSRALCSLALTKYNSDDKIEKKEIGGS
jgi:hypothetical protein